MLKIEKKQLLTNSELNQYLNSNELDMLFKHSKILTYQSGEKIIRQGKNTDYLYFILSGFVMVNVKIFDQRIKDLEKLGPGCFFGEISFIEKVPSSTSIVATNQVQCLLITNIYIELLSVFFPETKYKLYLAMLKQICNKLKILHDKIVEFMSNSDMISRSMFGEMINLLTKPTEITLDEAKIKVDQLYKLLSFQEMSKKEIDELLKHIIFLNAPKHCTIIKKGEKNPSCFIVIHGAIQSSIIHDNKYAKLSVIGPGILFASVSCIDNKLPSTITFATCEQAVLCKISESDLTILQKEHPLIWYKLFNQICISIVALEKSIDKLGARLEIENYNR